MLWMLNLFSPNSTLFIYILLHNWTFLTTSVKSHGFCSGWYWFNLYCCPRIQCSQACGPFVNYTTSWEALPAAVSELPQGVQTFFYALSSETFAVSFFVVTWCVFRLVLQDAFNIFLFLCLAVNENVSPLKFGHVLCDRSGWSSQESHQPTKGAACHGLFVYCVFWGICWFDVGCLSVDWYLPSLCHFVPQEGNDKRFLIQKMVQAQKKLKAESKQRRSRSPRSPCYHTSFASNFPVAMCLSHSPPDSSTQVWRKELTFPVQHWSQISIFSHGFILVWTLTLAYICRPADISVSRLLSVFLLGSECCWTISEQMLRSF